MAPLPLSPSLSLPQIMAPLHHSNLVHLFGAVWSEGPDKLCIVLEYVEGGSLQDVLVPGLNRVTWSGAGFGLAHGTAKCMRYLHHDLRDPILHRDLKPANVLVDQSMVPKVSVTIGYRRMFKIHIMFTTIP